MIIIIPGYFFQREVCFSCFFMCFGILRVRPCSVPISPPKHQFSKKNFIVFFIFWVKNWFVGSPGPQECLSPPAKTTIIHVSFRPRKNYPWTFSASPWQLFCRFWFLFLGALGIVSDSLAILMRAALVTLTSWAQMYDMLKKKPKITSIYFSFSVRSRIRHAFVIQSRLRKF